MTERSTDDEAALRAAVERLANVELRWRSDAEWLRDNAYRASAREVSAEADALALVLRRVLETMKQEG